MTLVTRIDCSLCEAMEHELAHYQGRTRFTLKRVDVDSSEQLVADFGDKVPVLLAGREELCRYYFDPERLDGYFSPP